MRHRKANPRHLGFHFGSHRLRLGGGQQCRRSVVLTAAAWEQLGAALLARRPLPSGWRRHDCSPSGASLGFLAHFCGHFCMFLWFVCLSLCCSICACGNYCRAASRYFPADFRWLRLGPLMLAWRGGLGWAGYPHPAASAAVRPSPLGRMFLSLAAQRPATAASAALLAGGDVSGQDLEAQEQGSALGASAGLACKVGCRRQLAAMCPGPEHQIPKGPRRPSRERARRQSPQRRGLLSVPLRAGSSPAGPGLERASRGAARQAPGAVLP